MPHIDAIPARLRLGAPSRRCDRPNAGALARHRARQHWNFSAARGQWARGSSRGASGVGSDSRCHLLWPRLGGRGVPPRDLPGNGERDREEQVARQGLKPDIAETVDAVGNEGSGGHQRRSPAGRVGGPPVAAGGKVRRYRHDAPNSDDPDQTSEEGEAEKGVVGRVERQDPIRRVLIVDGRQPLVGARRIAELTVRLRQNDEACGAPATRSTCYLACSCVSRDNEHQLGVALPQKELDFIAHSRCASRACQ